MLCYETARENKTLVTAKKTSWSFHSKFSDGLAVVFCFANILYILLIYAT